MLTHNVGDVSGVISEMKRGNVSRVSVNALTL